MNSSQYAVMTDRLHVRYGRQMAVRGLTLRIPPGEVFGFIGPNGAGKTSTIKVLATLIKPFSGQAWVNGLNVIHDPHAVRKNIGYVPDYFGVYDDLTVTEYLHFFAAAYRLDRAKRKSVVGDVLALTDLTSKADAQVDALSRGMKQRLGIARVLLHDPGLLLLDEPASGLDPRARIELRELLKELRHMGKTIIVSSHILHELSQFCTRIGIIEDGQLVADGSLNDIYRTLGFRRVVHVQLTNRNEELIDRIRLIEGVEKVDTDTDRLAVHVREEDLPLDELLSQMHAAGARMQMFQPEAMDMETAFMKLTTGKVS